MEAVRELRTKGKRQGYLRLKFYFGGLRLLCSVDYFPEPVEIVASLGQGVEIYYGIIFGNYKFEGPSCVQLICLTEAATIRRDTIHY